MSNGLIFELYNMVSRNFRDICQMTGKKGLKNFMTITCVDTEKLTFHFGPASTVGQTIVYRPRGRTLHLCLVKMICYNPLSSIIAFICCTIYGIFCIKFIELSL